MSEIRGLVIQSRLDYLETEQEKTVLSQVLEKLSDPVRQAVGEQVFPTNLYPFGYLRELDEALSNILAGSNDKLFSSIGQKYAEKTLDRYFFNYVESKSPQKFLAQIEKLYPHLWHFGSYSYRKTDARAAQLRFDYDEDMNSAYCSFMQAFIKRGLELCGAKKVVLGEDECEAEGGTSCVYQISWSV